MDRADRNRGGQNAKSSGRSRVYQADGDIYVNVEEQHEHHSNGVVLNVVVLLAVAVVAALVFSLYEGKVSTRETRGPAIYESGSSPRPQWSGLVKIDVRPTGGQRGAAVAISGSGFDSGEVVRIELFDGARLTYFQGPYQLGDYHADFAGRLTPTVTTIPMEICCAGGEFNIVVTGRTSHHKDQIRFHLT